MKKSIVLSLAILLSVYTAVYAKCAEIPQAKQIKLSELTSDTFVSKRTQIAVIAIEGTIMSADKWVVPIVHCIHDPNIAGVIIKMNSGGGAVGTGEALYNALSHLRSKKPVLIFVENLCCSAAYLTACGASKVYTTRMADIGNIGVLIEVGKIKPEDHPNKVNIEVLTAGKYKAVEHPNAPQMTDEQRAYLLLLVQQHYQVFCNIVAQERNLSLDDKDVWAEARRFTGEQALEQGLVDGYGSMVHAQELMKKAFDDRHVKYTDCIDMITITNE